MAQKQSIFVSRYRFTTDGCMVPIAIDTDGGARRPIHDCLRIRVSGREVISAVCDNRMIRLSREVTGWTGVFID